MIDGYTDAELFEFRRRCIELLVCNDKLVEANARCAFALISSELDRRRPHAAGLFVVHKHKHHAVHTLPAYGKATRKTCR
jgi:hypothetical protein